MNARSQIFELTVEGRQADEAVASLFHTVLFHRSTGKFHYSTEGSYAISTVGYTDVDCDFIDLTYVCCTSPRLDQTLKREISCFSEQLRGSSEMNNFQTNNGTNNSGGGGINSVGGAGGGMMGQISLEFFQKKPSRWLFQQECIPWEVWTVRLELITLNNEGERQICREKVGELLTDKILYITEVMNRHDYLPKMPNQSELDLIFDTSYTDVQPYLFKVNYSISGPSTGTSVGSTMKKIIKETLAM